MSTLLLELVWAGHMPIKELEMAEETDSYVAFFLNWNQVAMKGRENPNEAPPTRTKNSRTLFFVWKGMFCWCVQAYLYRFVINSK